MIVFFLDRSAKWDVFVLGVMGESQFQAVVPSHGFSAHVCLSFWQVLNVAETSLEYSIGPRQLVLFHRKDSGCPRASLMLRSHTSSCCHPGLRSFWSCRGSDAWTGSDHLPAGSQERCVPTHIMEALNVWLTAQCEVTHFWQNQFPCFSQPMRCCLRTRTTVATFSLWTSLGFRSSGREKCGCSSKLRNCSASVHRCTSSWSSDSCVCTVTVH